jgi:peptidoglycan/LPS O-acetylase OafA/YrhL
LAVVVGAALVVLAGPESSSLNLLLLTIFGVSALLYVHRDRVPLRPWLAAAALALWAASAWLPFSSALAALAVPYLVVYVAYAAPKALRRLTRHGDVSYGLYLFAFPVQQAIVLVAGRGGLAPLALAAIAFPITYLLALLSWRVVERPALGLKRVVKGRRLAGGSARAPATS